jgi:hypothetical protein
VLVHDGQPEPKALRRMIALQHPKVALRQKALDFGDESGLAVTRGGLVAQQLDPFFELREVHGMNLSRGPERHNRSTG